MIRFRIISLRAGVILVFFIVVVDFRLLDLFEPCLNPTPSLIRYPLYQRILGARTCHMQLVNRVIDSCLKVVNPDSNHHQVLCAFLLHPPPPILSSIYSSMISDFDTCQAEHTIVSAEITMIFYIINDFVIFILKFEIVTLQFIHLYL